MTGITIVSKSPWEPAIRREHHFAKLAVRRGHPVTFIEQPTDVRSAPGAWRSFLAGLSGAIEVRDDLRLVRRSVVVPGHRGRLAQMMDNVELQRTIARLPQPAVGYLPWQFAATAAAPRRVFDCTDDWLSLYPLSSGPQIRSSLERIAAEADEIIVVSTTLLDQFPGRRPVLVPNGVDRSAVLEQARPKPGSSSLVFVGTLSERFDAELVAAVMRALPDWRLDIYGPCRYAGLGGRPSPDLAGLLDELGQRVELHGPVPKEEVGAVLDRADVLIVPNVPALSEGQASMKLLDAAARGRPAVVSEGVTVDGSHRPPGTAEAATVDEWRDAILAAASEESSVAQERLSWARANTWDHRWQEWVSVVLGKDEGGSHRHGE